MEKVDVRVSPADLERRFDDTMQVALDRGLDAVAKKELSELRKLMNELVDVVNENARTLAILRARVIELEAASSPELVLAEPLDGVTFESVGREPAATTSKRHMDPSHTNSKGRSIMKLKVTKEEASKAGKFCTGTQSLCPIPEVDPYVTPLDQDGELAYMVRQRLDEGHSLKQIAWALDLHWMQVLGVAQTVSSPPHVVKGDRYDDELTDFPEPESPDDTPHKHVQMEGELNESDV
jgi:hypothetical protein